MRKQTKPTSCTFLVFGDVFIIYIWPVLMGIINSLLLLAYSWFSGTTKLDHLTLMWGALTCAFWIGEETMRIGENTPHLRTNPNDMKKYMQQFLSILMVSCLIAVAFHFVLSLLEPLLIPMIRDFDIFMKRLILPTLAGLLELFIFRSLAHRTFIYIPLTEEPAELVRGNDLASGDDVQGRAWKDV